MSPNSNKINGFGLPVAIFVITVLAMIVAAITSLSESSNVAFGQDINSIKAFYAAESGAEIGLARSFAVTGIPEPCAANIYVDNSGLTGLNGCSVTVDCSIATVDGIDYYTLTSAATCGSGRDAAQREVEVRAKGS
jgi:MSHA biogenesis protein MshP